MPPSFFMIKFRFCCLRPAITFSPSNFYIQPVPPRLTNLNATRWLTQNTQFQIMKYPPFPVQFISSAEKLKKKKSKQSCTVLCKDTLVFCCFANEHMWLLKYSRTQVSQSLFLQWQGIALRWNISDCCMSK